MKINTHFKGLVMVLILVFSANSYAQEILKPTNEKTYSAYMNKILESLVKNDWKKFKGGILYDRVYPMAKLDVFNDSDSTNTSNYEHFMRAWGELESASINFNHLSSSKAGDIAYSFERENKIQIGILNVDFTYINPAALEPNNATLKIVNNKIQRISKKALLRRNRESAKPIKATYINKHLFMASPLNSNIVYSNNLQFEFGKLTLNASNKNIKNLQVNFEENQSYTIINNGFLVRETVSPTFESDGIKKIEFVITFNDHSKLKTVATFYLKTKTSLSLRASTTSSLQNITATKPFQGYDEATDCGGTCYGEGEYKVFYANGNTVIKNPFIIVDGFDPNDVRKIGALTDDPDEDKTLVSSMYYNNKANNLVKELIDQGYDVIIINFTQYVIRTETRNDYSCLTDGPLTTYNIYRDGGADYIERNAKVLEALLEKIKLELIANGSSKKIKIAGPSMGALIVQYALVDMEKNNEDHYTDLFVSFDGPHKGANASIGMQKALQYFATGSGVVEDFVNGPANAALTALNSPAAKQMLIHHYLSDTSGISQGAPNFRNRFQNLLDTNGFPKQSRNIALINGSTLGHKTGQVGTNMLRIHLDAILNGFLRRDLWINYTSNSGNKEVFRFLKKNWWGLHTQADIKKYSSTSSNFGSLDNAPGGFLNIKGIAEEALGGNFPYNFSNGSTNIEAYYKAINPWARIGITTASLLVGGIHAYVDLQDNTVFVPTKSALAFSGSDVKWDEQIGCRNLVCTSETPFDSYYVPTENQEHASLHVEGISWLLKEVVEDIEQVPSVFSGCAKYSLAINGDDTLCNNQTASYTLNNCSSTVTWSASNNLQILLATNQQITVKNTNANTSISWISASLNDETISKNILGKPSISYTIEQGSFPSISLYGLGIPINQQGIYNTQWVKTGGTGQIHNTNSFSTYASGSGSDWYVAGNVMVTNLCGTSTKSFYISPPANPCNEIQFEKVASNHYRIVQPCNEELLIQNTASIRAALYTIYGIKKPLFIDENGIHLKNNPKGSVMILKATAKGKTISKMIL
ncbi:MAG: hypothetical protein JKY30_12000, partial [Flavobacteriales bacterium]|nr:hypothetical protein [Flavobacteriales bacterium]